MTTWHWVRHGPTHEKSFVGWRDVPADLSDRAQIDRLRTHLPRDAVLIASDLARARQTADAIMQGSHNRLPDNPHLREIHFGLWDGMHFKDIAARDPLLNRQFWETPGDISAPGGESWNAAAARVQAAVRHISHHHPGRDIIAVAHFGVILMQLQHALGLPAAQAMDQKISNFSVTRIEWKDRGATVPLINHVP